jgi:hypothetical protein
MDRGHRSQVAQKEKAQLATMIPKRNEFFTSALSEDDKEPFASTSHFGAELLRKRVQGDAKEVMQCGERLLERP